MKKWMIAIALMATAGVQATIVADLDADWQVWQDNLAGPSMTESGWAFQWNPTGQHLIGGTWSDLTLSPSWSYRETAATAADASVAYSETQPVSINDGDLGVGNIYGGKNSVLSSDGNTHYMITAYTIQAGEAGIADIISSGNAGTISELNILLNGKILTSSFGTAFNFSADDVTLEAGDVVSFAFANLLQDVNSADNTYVDNLTTVNKNTTRLYAQYQIDVDVIPEPSSFGLVALFSVSMIFYRRRLLR